MAEIPIQRKEHRSLWWLWLLLIVIVLGIAWYYWTHSGNVAVTSPADSTAVTAPPGSSAPAPQPARPSPGTP